MKSNPKILFIKNYSFKKSIMFIIPSILCQSAQDAITKYHSLGKLNRRNSFLTFLEAGKTKINVLADLISDKSLLPGL